MSSSPAVRQTLPRALLERARIRLVAARLLDDAVPAGGDADPDPIVLLLPAADDAPSRRWPWEHWAELARGLRRAQPRLRLGVLTTAAELWPAVRIHEVTGRLLPVLGPDLDAALELAVLAHARLAVGVDNRHLRQAAALGVATIGLYGPTDPYANPPAGDLHTAIFERRWCAPCGLRRCLLLHHRCLRALPPQVVIETCLERLGAAAAG